MQAISAMSQHRIIGKDGKMPWHIKSEFQWFKKFTMGKDLIVGSTTFQDLPPLQGRRIWLLSNSLPKKPTVTLKNGEEWPYKWINDIDYIPKDAVIAGGASVYQQLLPYCSDFYVSIIRGEYDGDTFMPPFEHLFKGYEVVLTDPIFEVRHYFIVNPKFPQYNC